jgi:nucleotide-binding universal stress UspA family protein
MIKRILVPLDFSPPSLQALDYAADTARRFGAELVLLHVVEPAFFAATNGIYGVGFDAGIVYREMEQAARQQLAELADSLRARRIAARVLLSVGRAHEVIVDAAKKMKVDLVVMSTHGRTGLSHVVMGSVAERVVRTAACPVLTMHPRRAVRRRRPARRLRRVGAERPLAARAQSA